MQTSVELQFQQAAEFAHIPCSSMPCKHSRCALTRAYTVRCHAAKAIAKHYSCSSIVLIVLLQVADKNALLLLKQYRTSQWRVDKLANRVAFERAIAAIRLLSTAAQDGASSSSSNKQQQLSYYGSAPVD